MPASEALPWWTTEPAPKPGEGIKLVSRRRDLLVMIEDRRYRVRGLASLISQQHLKLLLWLWMGEQRNYWDTVELHDPQQRRDFIVEAAAECKLPADLVERDLAFIVRECERLRDDMLQHAAEEKNRSSTPLH